MSQPAKAQEPSMEEILASIRRIIADDDTAKPAAAGRRRAATDAAPRAAAARRDAAAHAGSAVASAAAASRTRAWISATSTRCWPGSMRRPAHACAVRRRARTDRADGGAEPKPKRRASGPSTGSPTWSSPIAPAQPDPPASAWPRSRGGSRFRRNPAPVDRTLMSSTTSAAVDSAFNSLAQTVLVQNARTLEDLVRRCCGRCSSPGSTTICRAWSSGIVRGRDRARLARAQLTRRALRPAPRLSASRGEPAAPAPAARSPPRSEKRHARRSGRPPAPRAATPAVWPMIERRGEQRDRGAARLRRHLRARSVCSVLCSM